MRDVRSQCSLVKTMFDALPISFFVVVVVIWFSVSVSLNQNTFRINEVGSEVEKQEQREKLELSRVRPEMASETEFRRLHCLLFPIVSLVKSEQFYLKWLLSLPIVLWQHLHRPCPPMNKM